MIVDIGKYYSKNFTVAEIRIPIFNVMAPIIPFIQQLSSVILLILLYVL